MICTRTCRTVLGKSVTPLPLRLIWLDRCGSRGIQGVASRTFTLHHMESVSGDAPPLLRRSSRLIAKCSSSVVVSANRRYAIDESVAVEHDPKMGQFYIEEELARAYVEYERDGQLIRILHTEVPPELEGRGLGKILAKAALEYVSRNDLSLVIDLKPNRIEYASMDGQDYTCLVLYYGRVRFYHSMQKMALDGLAKYPTQSAFRLFNGIALALGNRVQEGIRELNPLKNESELGLAAILALIYAHKRCSVVDRDALLVLEQRMKEERSALNASTAYYAAVFLFLTGRTEKAREYAEKALKANGGGDDGGDKIGQGQLVDASASLKAWTELTQQTGDVSGNILHTFEAVLARGGGKNIDASLGIVRYYQLRGKFEHAVAALNKLSTRFPELNIPLIEKMETQLAVLDWEHAFETALRIVNLDPVNVMALRVKAMLLIGRESNFRAGVATLQQLLAATERVENGNYDLLLQICQLFSRICAGNRDVLALILRYVDKLVQQNATAVEFITELGYTRLLLGNIKEAAQCFRTATKMDDNYFHALCGLTLCQLGESGRGGSTVIDSSFDQVRQQIEFLGQLRATEREPLLLFLNAKITVEQSDRATALLIEATEIHLRRLEPLAFGTEYLRLLNPDFMLQLAAELLRHSPIQVRVKRGGGAQMLGADTVHITLKHCASILETVVRACPGHLQAIFMRAKVEFLCGEVSTAAHTLQRILNDIDATHTSAHLLLAQIQLQQQQTAKASQSLELALSHNFAVRDNPMYHLLLGIVQKQQQQLGEAQKSFLAAMQLLGGPFVSTDQPPLEKPSTILSGAGSAFAMSDKVTLYLELIDTFRQAGDAQGTYESERLLQCAMEEFSHTSEEGRLVIAHAELMLQSCNVAKAINLLASIQPGQSYFIQAKTQLANIYLQHHRDRVAFAKCFKELVEACPETESYLMLGEAYMSIQEPDLAVDAYQSALNINPNDSLLASKLGRAYVKTHQYARAIQYYQEALKNPDHFGLKLDLAELYLKLKQYQNAAETLADDVEQQRKTDEDPDIISLQVRTKQLLLLARIHEKSGQIVMSLQTLKEARDNQYRVQKRVSVDQSGNIIEQHKILSKICLLMAQQSISLRENEQALKCFKESLKYTPNDIEILSALARLYMQTNSMELCRDVCMQILQIDSNNEVASVMMADLSFRKMEFENAAFHFSQLLISQPCYWTALARLIEVMRRSGTLQDVNSFLQRAEQVAANPAQTSGLNYCRGLYEWYSGNPNGALRSFNAARRDHEWGQQAIFNMIEICINPDGDIPNGGDIQEAADSGEFSDSRLIALRTAERLLKELRPRPGGMDNEALNHRLLHNFLQLASKQKFQIESALQDFTDLATRDEYQNMVGPVLGMASALVLLKQVQRAKNQLKRIVRVPWNFEEAEYLERSWLLLADIYIHANKLDVAESFVDRVLEHNKSSTKAYESAGYIAEKSQVYRDAAKHYHNAWNCGGRSKPHIGYKLAYNHMKTKRFADAIDVCQQVMKLHPDYTIIRKDILDKCRNNLRP